MKNLLIISIILSTFALTACDNAQQKRREECTKAQNDMSDAFFSMTKPKDVGIAGESKWKEEPVHRFV